MSVRGVAGWVAVSEGAATAPNRGEQSTGVSRLDGRRCRSPGETVRAPAAPGLLEGVTLALIEENRKGN
jgi:hypothetical protein